MHPCGNGAEKCQDENSYQKETEASTDGGRNWKNEIQGGREENGISKRGDRVKVSQNIRKTEKTR